MCIRDRTKRERRDLEQFLQAPVVEPEPLEDWSEESQADWSEAPLEYEPEEPDGPSPDLLDWDNW